MKSDMCDWKKKWISNVGHVSKFCAPKYT